MPSIAVVIPTIGRPQLPVAVRSAGAGVLYAGTDYPLRWSLTNFGGS